ncbi:hypothetical protein [Cytophaga hutchinsonii]|uniref:Uncharacterized protein n=1 Tax=Cytophaga hutchinsonii (strain ATCC 33406 / DSM 1761 / CIP 103989 / NBRC 15051 / NCIMB 9469 / D465) TaxID=269798 RepID=A0A6N4SW76_CYTH3|nr:hypothetical protein [Cytophaga hutchinsonii]ABG60578.1 hypothetical protein CHU_3342 [Cytophaga hutchinsonii ATCC 33406]SFX89593.1 hypothetical protein SAMN04487930_11250 [Cytophaga hutchinsonii ATCC 33406]
MKNTIVLSINHPNAKRMEYFLNRIDEVLVAAPFEWRSWKKSDCIHDGCRFVSVKEKDPVKITILFCDSYHEANTIGKENKLPYLPTAKWSINGDVLYLVESADADKVSDILGLFAGEE